MKIMYVYDDTRGNNWPGKQVRNPTKSFNAINECIFDTISKQMKITAEVGTLFHNRLALNAS